MLTYLSGHACPGCRSSVRGDLGWMIQPGSYAAPAPDGRPFALDNGCFGGTWTERRWLRWLAATPPGCLFAVVPDVLADPVATAARWTHYWPKVHRLGLPAAYVAQDGETVGHMPWAELDVVFLGGHPDTGWKTSEAAHHLVVAARDRGKVTHMGRVNTWSRLQVAASWGMDSVDGTLLGYGCDTNLPRLGRYLDWVNAQPSLPLFG